MAGTRHRPASMRCRLGVPASADAPSGGGCPGRRSEVAETPHRRDLGAISDCRGPSQRRRCAAEPGRPRRWRRSRRFVFEGRPFQIMFQVRGPARRVCASGGREEEGEMEWGGTRQRAPQLDPRVERGWNVGPIRNELPSTRSSLWASLSLARARARIECTHSHARTHARTPKGTGARTRTGRPREAGERIRYIRRVHI